MHNITSDLFVENFKSHQQLPEQGKPTTACAFVQPILPIRQLVSLLQAGSCSWSVGVTVPCVLLLAPLQRFSAVTSL